MAKATGKRGHRTKAEDALSRKATQHHDFVGQADAERAESRAVEQARIRHDQEQLEKEVAGLENKIAKVEAEIAELELSFQNPATGTDWETTHKQYADLKVVLEHLYEDLARRWELMG